MLRILILLLVGFVAQWALANPGYAGCDAGDNVPDSTLCNVLGAITITPDGTWDYQVSIKGPWGPVVGDSVVISVSPAADTLIAWDPDPGEQPPFVQITNPAGVATFNIKGGGCVEPGSFPVIAEVRVLGTCGDGTPYNVLVGTPYVNSPDVVNRLGQLASTLGSSICGPDSITLASLADAVYHTDAIRLSLVNPCSKVVPPYDVGVELGDAVILSTYIGPGTEGRCIP